MEGTQILAEYPGATGVANAGEGVVSVTERPAAGLGTTLGCHHHHHTGAGDSQGDRTHLYWHLKDDLFDFLLIMCSLLLPNLQTTTFVTTAFHFGPSFIL